MSIIIMQILLILVLLVAVTYVSVKLTVDKLGGEESERLGVGIALILVGFFVFAICGEDQILLPQAWSGDSNLLYYLVRYGALLLAVIGIVVSLVAIYKRTDRLETEIKELRRREMSSRSRNGD